MTPITASNAAPRWRPLLRRGKRARSMLRRLPIRTGKGSGTRRPRRIMPRRTIRPIWRSFPHRADGLRCFCAFFGRVGRPPLLCRQDRHGCDLPVDRRRLWNRLAGGRDSNRLREFHGFCGRAFEAIGISGYGANIQTGKGPFRCKWRGLLYFPSAGVGFRHRSIVYFVAGKLEKRPGMQVHS